MASGQSALVWKPASQIKRSEAQGLHAPGSGRLIAAFPGPQLHLPFYLSFSSIIENKKAGYKPELS